MDPPTPTEAPPPAYELEHDYDRKISDALERSLSISQQAQPVSSMPHGEDEWEEWDEARFEAAAAAARAHEQGGDTEQPQPPILRHLSEKERLARRDELQAQQHSECASSSSSAAPVAEPSRRLPTSPPTKERPSWYSEAQLDTSAGSGSLGQSSQALPPTPQFHNIPSEEDDPDEPLPPFAPVAPSLEGPPFEEVVTQPPRIPPVSNVDSPPQSPLDSVDSDGPSEPQPYSPPPPSHRISSGRSRTTSPRQSQAPSVPRVVSVPASSTRPPPMRFDPSVAYAKQRNTNPSVSEAESREPIDASALYNSAVSSLLVSQNPKRKNTSHNRELPARPATTRPESQYSFQSVPSVSPVALQSPAQYGVPNTYYPMHQNQGYTPTQHPTYPQQPPLPQLQHLQQPPPQPQPPHLQQPQPQPQPQHFQQPQQVAPGYYGVPFRGGPQGGPPPPPPPPTQWYPPHNMSPGGGYGR